MCIRDSNNRAGLASLTTRVGALETAEGNDYTEIVEVQARL